MGLLGLGGGSLLQQNLGSNYIDQIYEKIAEQKAVLVLGPNLATMAVNGQNVPITVVLASELEGFLRKENIEFDAQESQAFDYLAMRCISCGRVEVNAVQLPLFVRNVCTQYATQVPEVYHELAKIPFHLVLNASFDNFMQQAWSGKAHQAHYNYQKNSTQAIPDFSPEKPLVYNLFGIYTEPDSLVLSTADQIEFINKLTGNASRIPNAILSQLNNDNLYVFMGFDANSWHLPLLFRMLNFQQNSAAFYYEPQKLSQKHEDIYRDIFKFQVKNIDYLALAKQLASGFPAWQAKQASSKPQARAYSSKPEKDLQNRKSKILFLTSNPKDTQLLNLNREYNKVEEELRSHKDGFEIKLVPDVNKNTLSRVLNEYAPHVLHFSGHGENTGLLFYSDAGYSDQVSGEALGKVLSFYPSISCVLLNACYSETQALAIAQFVPCVIGVAGAVGDDKAILFAERFYRHLFADRSYEEAFQMAVSELAMSNQASQFAFYKDSVKQ